MLHSTKVISIAVAIIFIRFNLRSIDTKSITINRANKSLTNNKLINLNLEKIEEEKEENEKQRKRSSAKGRLQKAAEDDKEDYYYDITLYMANRTNRTISTNVVTADRFGVMIPAMLIIAAIFALASIILFDVFRSYHFRWSPEEQVTMTHCHPDNMTHEYKIIFRVGCPTAWFDMRHAFIDFELLGSGDETIGIPVRFDCARLIGWDHQRSNIDSKTNNKNDPNRSDPIKSEENNNKSNNQNSNQSQQARQNEIEIENDSHVFVIGEMHMLIGRITALPPIIGVRVTHSEPFERIFFFDYTLHEIVCRSKMIPLETNYIRRYITSRPTIFRPMSKEDACAEARARLKAKLAKAREAGDAKKSKEAKQENANQMSQLKAFFINTFVSRSRSNTIANKVKKKKKKKKKKQMHKKQKKKKKKTKSPEKNNRKKIKIKEAKAKANSKMEKRNNNNRNDNNRDDNRLTQDDEEEEEEEEEDAPQIDPSKTMPLAAAIRWSLAELSVCIFALIISLAASLMIFECFDLFCVDRRQRGSLWRSLISLAYVSPLSVFIISIIFIGYKLTIKRRYQQSRISLLDDADYWWKARYGFWICLISISVMSITATIACGTQITFVQSIYWFATLVAASIFALGIWATIEQAVMLVISHYAAANDFEFRSRYRQILPHAVIQFLEQFHYHHHEQQQQQQQQQGIARSSLLQQQQQQQQEQNQQLSLTQLQQQFVRNRKISPLMRYRNDRTGGIVVAGAGGGRGGTHAKEELKTMYFDAHSEKMSTNNYLPKSESHSLSIIRPKLVNPTITNIAANTKSK